MNTHTLEFIDLLVSNALIIWLALRLVKRIDTMDSTLDRHETRITVLEKTDHGSTTKKSHA